MQAGRRAGGRHNPNRSSFKPRQLSKPGPRQLPQPQQLPQPGPGNPPSESSPPPCRSRLGCLRISACHRFFTALSVLQAASRRPAQPGRVRGGVRRGACVTGEQTAGSGADSARERRARPSALQAPVSGLGSAAPKCSGSGTLPVVGTQQPAGQPAEQDPQTCGTGTTPPSHAPGHQAAETAQQSRSERVCT